MKKKLSLRERFHKYMCTLENRSWNDPIFLLYLLYEACRISVLVWIAYSAYRVVKYALTWI